MIDTALVWCKPSQQVMVHECLLQFVLDVIYDMISEELVIFTCQKEVKLMARMLLKTFNFLLFVKFIPFQHALINNFLWFVKVREIIRIIASVIISKYIKKLIQMRYNCKSTARNVRDLYLLTISYYHTVSLLHLTTFYCTILVLFWHLHFLTEINLFNACWFSLFF